jgi:outer membrane receptor protein involved in Fe transport
MLTRRPHTAIALAAILLIAVASTTRAQGLAGAAVSGTVSTDSGGAAAGAMVRVTNRATGWSITLATNAAGRFNVENVPAGGPYRIVASARGFAPAVRDSVRLVLGQRYTVALVLTPTTITLAPVNVVASNPLLSSARTGAAYTVTDSAIQRLPLIDRDFTDLLQTAPYVVGTSVAGAGNRMNNILVDGITDNDFFGLSRGTGTPGGQEGARSLPLGAVQEFQILLAPYDVRQSGFTGGQVNAITRSGTNEFHGSALIYFQNDALSGALPGGGAKTDFDSYQYGITLGGPVVRDRLHFFIAAEARDRTSPSSGALIAPGSDAGIPLDSAERFASLLEGYGIAPGSFGAYSTRNRARNVFAKLSAPIGASGLVETSINYAHGITEDSIAPARVAGGDYRFTSSAFAPTATTWAARARWTQLFANGLSNELLAGYSTTDEPRTPSSGAPGIFVSGVGEAGARLIAGGDPSSQRLTLTQRAVELTDNLTRSFGAHDLTVGAQLQLLHFDFTAFSSSVGQYSFANLDSLALGRPSTFIRNIPLRPGAPTAAFPVHNYAAYLQDRWSVSDRLVVTGGVRADIVSLPKAPTENADLAASSFGINTASFIGTSVLWSPRLGANWAVRDGTVLRGGAGMFTGRDPYSWLAFAYSNTGSDTRLITCRGADAPDFVADPAAQPESCVSGVPTSSTPVSYFTPDFRMPQVARASLGVDQQLPWGVVASFDADYSYGLHSLYITDVNLGSPVGTLDAEGGRIMYGTVSEESAAGALPTVAAGVVDPAFAPILRNGNRSGDRAWTATAQLEKRFGSGVELNAAYTYTNAKDYLSLRDAQSVSNYGFAPVDGSLADRQLAVSSYSIPHKVTVSGTVELPLDLSLSLVYIGRSGDPFMYVVNGDANADLVGNRTGTFDRQLDDPVYIPRGRDDISLVRDAAGGGGGSLLVGATSAAYDSLEAFIESDPCLREHRGELLPRNACRNPWQNLLDMRIAERVHIPGGRTVELSLDAINVLHLIDSDWGNVRQTGTLSGAGTENVPMLKLRGQDPSGERNRYELTLPRRNVIDRDLSRWRLQLGARYIF